MKTSSARSPNCCGCPGLLANGIAPLRNRRARSSDSPCHINHPHSRRRTAQAGPRDAPRRCVGERSQRAASPRRPPGCSASRLGENPSREPTLEARAVRRRRREIGAATPCPRLDLAAQESPPARLPVPAAPQGCKRPSGRARAETHWAPTPEALADLERCFRICFLMSPAMVPRQEASLSLRDSHCLLSSWPPPRCPD